MCLARASRERLASSTDRGLVKISLPVWILRCVSHLTSILRSTPSSRAAVSTCESSSCTVASSLLWRRTMDQFGGCHGSEVGMGRAGVLLGPIRGSLAGRVTKSAIQPISAFLGDNLFTNN